MRKIKFLITLSIVLMAGCIHHVTPLPYPFEDKNMFFGLTILKKDVDYELAYQLNITWVSMQPVVVWFTCEPQPGVYRWNSIDEQIKKLQSIELDCTPVLMPINVFGENRTRLIEELDDRDILAFLRSSEAAEWKLYPHGETLQTWKIFLRKLVERYNGDGINDMPGLKYPIRHWHFLEEYPEEWLGDVENYVELLRKSYPIIKQVDKKAEVILLGLASNYARFFAFVDGFIEDEDAGVWNGTRYTREEILSNQRFQSEKEGYEYILREGKNYFDIVDIHLYEEKISFMKGKIRWLKHKMEEYGYTKPIWCIEGGGPFKIPEGTNPKHGDSYFGYYNDRENSEFVVKMHTIAASEGIERFHWSLTGTPTDSYWDGPWWVMGLTTYEREKKPSYYTFNIMTNLLHDFQSVEEIPVENISLYKFTTPSGEIYVIWDENEEWHNINLTLFSGENISLIPIVTNLTSTGEPFYLNLEVDHGIPVSRTPIFIKTA